MSDWKSELSAKEAFLTFFDKQEYCDVQFLVSSTVIGAHKGFLQARSEVLCELTKDWNESQEPIVVDDLNADIFRAILRYIYSDEINITNENVFQYMFAASTFKMSHLESHCAQHLTSILNKDNVCSYVQQALDFSATAFQKECCKIFSKETHHILALPEFLNLSQGALSFLLDSDAINVLEIDLFATIKNWTVQQCKKEGLPEDGTNMRRVIGDALYKIRFATMTMLDFSNEVATIDGLLSDNEMLQTYKKIYQLKKDEIDCPFSAKARCMNCVSQDNIMISQRQLLQQNVLFSPSANWCAISSGVANWYSHNYMLNKKALEIVLQCCADLMNTSSPGSNMPTNLPQTEKQDCYTRVNEWHNLLFRNPNDMNAFMSKTNEVFDALTKLQ